MTRAVCSRWMNTYLVVENIECHGMKPEQFKAIDLKSLNTIKIETKFENGCCCFVLKCILAKVCLMLLKKRLAAPIKYLTEKALNGLSDKGYGQFKM